MSIKSLEFEKPIEELNQKIKQLKELSKSDNIDLEDEIIKSALLVHDGEILNGAFK